MKYNEIIPFFSQPCQRNLELFCRIEHFLHAELKFNWIWADPYGGAGGWGSCSTFTMSFDSEWNSVSYAKDHNLIHYMITIGLSGRGPLLTGVGYELQAGPPDAYVPPGGRSEVLGYGPIGQSKAREIAQRIAKEFHLIYLEREWLKQFSLNEDDLTENAACSLDHSEPTALNILFSEYL